MAKVRNIGMPVNDSERKAISTLAKALPDHYVLLSDLELPTRNGFPYEYDIIVIGDQAVFVIEVKGYRGLIRGNAYEWELSSGSIMKSPIPLLNTKAKIVSSRIASHSGSHADVWVKQLLVLTDERVSIDVHDPFASTIVRLDDAARIIMGEPGLPPKIDRAAMERIEDAIARQFMPLKRDKEIGDYRILEQVNRNELYTSLIGEHKLLGGSKKYILKVYTLKIYDNDEEQQQHRSRILREAQALAEMPLHPNIVRAAPPFPAGDENIVLPLEWVNGLSLRGLLDNKDTAGTVPVKQVLLDLCSALAHVHRCGVVHRDVRPDNVIVCADGTARLVNFDCAHLSGQTASTIASRLGRNLDERYVAPEVWLDPARASARSDIYSLGIILHELLTGRTPYQKIMDVFIAREIKSTIGSLRPDLDPQVEGMFLSMTDFDPNTRMRAVSVARDWIEKLL
jgi:serine/threonine protein kinase